MSSRVRGLDSQKERQNRRQAQVTMRTKNTQEQLQKRRNKDESQEHQEYAFSRFKQKADIQKLQQYAQMMYQGTPEEQAQATEEVKHILSAENNPPIDDVIRTQPSIIQKLIEFLSSPNSRVQFDATWAITNIASGTTDHTCALVNNNCVPKLIELLASSAEEIREQAAWALGNIAGDSPKYRDLVLSRGVLHPLLNVIVNNPKQGTLRNATWALSNFLRGKPVPDLDRIRPALPVLSKLLNDPDPEVVGDSLWAMSYVTDGPNERIQAALESDIAGRLLELLKYTSPTDPYNRHLKPTLRAVGNIVTGTDIQTDVMIQGGVLERLKNLLMDATQNATTHKECCWTISNITAGTTAQIQAVIDCGLLPVLVRCIEHSAIEVKKEATWALTNLMEGTPAQIADAVSNHCIPAFINMLKGTTTADPNITFVILEGLEKILRCGDAVVSENHVSENMFKIQMVECGFLSVLDQLQDNSYQQVYKKAIKIIEVFFPEEIDEPNEQIDMNEGMSQFNFS